MSPVRPELVPATTSDEITSPPSLMGVQFAPRDPSARLKSSAAFDTGVPAAQATDTLVTLALEIFPDPPVTVQISPDGLLPKVTL